MKTFAVISLLLGIGSIYETIHGRPGQLPIACILIGLAVILGLQSHVKTEFEKKD